MAFNFNWSPLIADTSRAREMLTTALNKTPKPPIIVDDIIVTELNLGSTPPELEILEVGDLAEDRFRGIFKMSYTGDAFLTLKTKVQANPLKTYLSAKPSFASPEPLAAASGLTIPLQITLSDIRLSGFVILVFSKQKGLTLVFRNDPLEGLKVSSTFDSIPFVRDYLQKEIEGQLRVLFMEELPAIIHRLSLRLWSPEYQELEETEERLDAPKDTTAPIDPLATNPPDAVDAFGNPIGDTPALTLETASEIHASFSRKNILRLAALSESQRTLSLFTPGIRDAVFRAWANNTEQMNSGAATPALTFGSLSRIQSTFNAARSKASSVASGSTGADTQSSRPTLYSNNSATTGLNLGANRNRAHPMRKRKKRVVDLRRNRDSAPSSGVSSQADTPAPSDISDASSIIPEDSELATTPKSQAQPPTWTAAPKTSEPSRTKTPTEGLLPAAPLPAESAAQKPAALDFAEVHSSSSRRPPLSHSRMHSTQQATSPLLRSLSFDKVHTLASPDAKSPISPRSEHEAAHAFSGGILEQAWLAKMTQDLARKVHEERERQRRAAERASGAGPSAKGPAMGGMWAAEESEIDAPPAYHA